MINTSYALKRARLQAVLTNTYRNNPPQMRLYDGTIPASTSDTPAGELIATLNATSATAPTIPSNELSVGLTFNAGEVMKASTPTFARVISGDGVVMMDVSLGAVGSGHPLVYNTSDFYLGGLVQVSSLSLTG